MADFEIQGLGDVIQRMRTLAPKLQQKGARAAARKGANVIRDAARNNAKKIDDPFSPYNQIWKNVAVQFASRSSKKEQGIVMRVGVMGGARNMTAYGEFQGRGRGNPGGDTWYWRLIEFGFYNNKAKKEIPANPFMRSALSSNVEKATQTTVAELNKQIDKLISAGVK